MNTTSFDEQLTPATARVLAALLAGHTSNKEIAQHLQINVRTVEHHMCDLYRRLNVRDRTALAIKALREQWIARAAI